MKGFDNNFIDEVKNKNDIVSIVGKYVRLEQRGRDFWGCCPFHHEKTPSFCVNSTQQFYYCFGCHKSGDVISFVQEIESLDFSDAVKFLAERAHIDLPDIEFDSEEIKQAKQKKEKIILLMHDAAMFYVKNLYSDKAQAYVEYIIKRKIPAQFVTKFGIGASLDFKSLPKYLEEKGYTKEEMLLSGAVSEKDGQYYDALGTRLIVPIINQFNQVIAFGGRLLEKSDFGKYKNTRDTLLFSKSNVLYNLNNIKKIKNEKTLSSIIMVEGYMDTISLVSAGIENVVASMGTSLTKNQARILKRYTDKVYISYDGDSAGQNATIRGLDILSDEGIEVKVVSLPEELDPDDIIKKYGAEFYNNLIINAKPLIDFKLEQVKKNFNTDTIDGKRKYVINACNVIRESGSPVEQEDLLKIVRDNTGYSFDALKRELYKDEIVKPAVIQNESKINENIDKNIIAVRFILFSFLFNKDYTTEFNLKELKFYLNSHIQIQDYIISKISANEKPKFTDLYEILPKEDEKELSAIAEMETDSDKKFDEEIFFYDCVQTIKRENLDKEINLLKEQFELENDNEKRRLIALEMTKLIFEKNKIK